MDWLRTETHFVDTNLGIERAYKDSFTLIARCTIHHCLWATEVILNALEMHKPELVYASYSGKMPVESLFIEPQEKQLGYIAREIALLKKMQFMDISTKAKGHLAYLIDNSSYTIKNITRFIAGLVRFKAWKNKSLKNKKPILFTSNLYQMDKLLTKVQTEMDNKASLNLEPTPMITFSMPHTIFGLFSSRKFTTFIDNQQKLFKDLMELINRRTDVFSYQGVSFSKVISTKIKGNISSFILNLVFWSNKLEKFIKESKPYAVVSGGNRFDDMILSEICKKQDIPTILISHGSHVVPKDDYETMEWRENNRSLLEAPFSYHALQSPHAEEYLNIFPTKGSVIKTGPLLWGRSVDPDISKEVYRKLIKSYEPNGNTKIIVHAGTPKQVKALRLYVYETPDEYIKSLYELASIVETMPNTYLIVRFRPNDEISAEALKSLVPFSDKVVLSVDESFLDVLGLADLLISFSSTTIEEALQNRIPVLLYGGDGRYQHIASSEPSAVHYVGKKEQLKNSIKSILDSNIKHSHRQLFDRFIYKEEDRQPFSDFLKQLQD